MIRWNDSLFSEIVDVKHKATKITWMANMMLINLSSVFTISVLFYFNHHVCGYVAFYVQVVIIVRFYISVFKRDIFYGCQDSSKKTFKKYSIKNIFNTSIKHCLFVTKVLRSHLIQPLHCKCDNKCWSVILLKW